MSRPEHVERCVALANALAAALAERPVEPAKITPQAWAYQEKLDRARAVRTRRQNRGVA